LTGTTDLMQPVLVSAAQIAATLHVDSVGRVIV
jgi:hypothetical protein